MISVKFKCPHCDKINDYHLFYNLNFRLCEYKGFGIVQSDSFVANCENGKKEVEFEIKIKQIKGESDNV